MNLRHRWMACTLLCALPAACQADIFRYGQQIPGPEGITPGPGVQLNSRELEFADLRVQNLAGANFERSNLTRADISLTRLTHANFTGALVNGVDFGSSVLSVVN